MSDKNNNKDKINLTELNKQKKSFTTPSLKNPFKKQTGLNRDDEGKFATTTGGGGLSTRKNFNWKRAIPVIVIVTIVGGFMVYRSFATTGGVRPKRSFTRSYSQINGGTLKTKSNGVKHRLITTNDKASATITRAEFVATESVCVNHITSVGKLSIKVDYLNNDNKKVVLNSNNSYKILDKSNICIDVDNARRSEFISSNATSASIEVKVQKVGTGDTANSASSQIYSMYGVEWGRATTQQITNNEDATRGGSAAGEEVLQRIYADQMIPWGYSSNQYLQQFVHTGTGTQDDGTGGRSVTIIDPIWTQASGRWDDSWPDKIKVCAITYHQLQNSETSVQLSVIANKRDNKVKILQKLKNLNPPNNWPKQELCSDPIARTYTQPATPGNPGGTFGPARSFIIYMKTVSVCAKQGERLTWVSDERCYTSSFKNDDHKKYPPYVPYLEQYIIKKAQ